MLSGNLFSLSLGTTISVAAIAFLFALRLGLAAAIVLTLLLGARDRRGPGCDRRLLRARTRSSSRSRAGAIQSGLATWLTEGTNRPAAGATAYERLGGSLLGIPFGFYVLVGWRS